MRKGTAFARTMLMFIGILTVSFAVLLGVFYFTMRNVHIQSRMDALKVQAYDIAYLSSIGPSSRVQRTVELMTGETSSVQDMLRQKIMNIHNDYTAYGLVVDANGRGTAYFLSVLEDHPDLRDSFDTRSIANTLSQVLSGREVVAQTEGQNGPMFTVAVPMMQGNRVYGAAYIQTAAQTVTQAYEGLFKRVLFIALGALLAAGAVAYWFSRRLSSPLHQMAIASEKLASGDFSHRVEVGGTEEMRQLADAFNTMSEKLHATEQQRRDFVANISHELRSPMTSISGFVQGILDGTVSKEDEQQYLHIVLDETNRLTKLTNTLLNLSRMEDQSFSLQLSIFDLNELIRRVLITKMASLEEKHLEVKLQFAPDPCIVDADRDQIEQVLLNLIDNAIKFTPESGWIRISTAVSFAKLVQITVTDNGIGIPSEDAPHIFDRFYTADKAHTTGRGTGLGLAISHRIIEKHGQQLVLLPGENGASFSFTLPVHKATKEERQ